MGTTARLRADIALLKARRSSLRQEVPADRVEFARATNFVPDPWQEDLLRSDSRRVLLNVSRQAGKSTVCALLGLHKALSVPGSLVLALAPALRQSQELFHKVARFYGGLGESVPADSHRRLGLELANGSRIEALPGSEKTVRGFSGVSLLLLDEASRVDDDLYHACRPMLAVSGGRLVMLSTPWGRRGVFYREWTEGLGWERYEVPASRCPRIPETFLEEERRSLPARVFRQEYECSFEENEDQLFSHELVRRSLTDEYAPLFGGEG